MALSNQFLLFLCLWCSIVDFPFTTAVISSNSKALSSNLPAKARTELVEGSGSIPPGLSSGKGDQLPAQSRPSDTEWNSSGVSPDDEDGDADDGAGSGKEIEGSGSPPIQVSANTRFPLSGTTTIASAPRTTTKPRHQENGPSPPSRENDHRAPITSTTPPLQRTTTTRAPPPFTINTRPLPPQQYPPYVNGGESFEALKPGILAAISGGAVVGLLMTILLVMFIVYRMRKKDEGSYSLDEPHPAGTNHYSYAYQKASTKEFYA